MFQDCSEQTYRMCLHGKIFLFHKNATPTEKKCGKKDVNVLYFGYNQEHESTLNSFEKSENSSKPRNMKQLLQDAVKPDSLWRCDNSMNNVRSCVLI